MLSCCPRMGLCVVLVICPQLLFECVLWFHFPITNCAFLVKTKGNVSSEIHMTPKRRKTVPLIFQGLLSAEPEKPCLLGVMC